MELKSRTAVENTRKKLRMLEELYEKSKRENDGSEHVRELSRRSIKRLINQLTEEIVRFESRAANGVGRKAPPHSVNELLNGG